MRMGASRLPPKMEHKKMNKSIKLSSMIVTRIPKKRRIHTLSNLLWVARNVVLSNTERNEVIQAIREERSNLT